MIDILDENIRNVIEVTDKLNICEKYNNLIIESLPENYSEFDKMKRKKVKRKSKLKAQKLLKNYIEENNKLYIKNTDSNTNNKLKLCDLEKLNFDI